MTNQMNPTAILSPEDLKNRHITVMGLGRFGGGVAAVRYLVHQQALVTVTDHLPEGELQESLAQIADLPLENVFCGDHPDEAFANCELLVANPAVKPDHAALHQCQSAAIPVVTEIQLLLQHLQAKSASPNDTPSDPDVGATVTVVAVTGSNGKSTTAALIHHFLTSEFESNSAGKEQGIVNRKCWLGGNIGRSLLPDVDTIQPGDVVVLELSSFQLHYLKDFAFAPDIAVLTGFSANHLDWHANLAHYQAAKQNLFRRQTRQQAAILPAAHLTNGQRSFTAGHDDEDQPAWRIRCPELRFGNIDDGQDGVFWEENSLIVRRRGIEDAVRMSLPPSLPGKHSFDNLTAAACAAIEVGADPIRFPTSVMKFRGLPYRLQSSGHMGSVRMFNDSASTTPESTIAAIQTLRQQLNRQVDRSSTNPKARLVVIVGGAGKGSDLKNLACQLNADADAVVAIGVVAGPLTQLMKQQSDTRCEHVAIAEDFQTAFRQAVELVASTGIVLLSPGFSSFGWFRDYIDRGQQFDSLVAQWMQR